MLQCNDYVNAAFVFIICQFLIFFLIFNSIFNSIFCFNFCFWIFFVGFQKLVNLIGCFPCFLLVYLYICIFVHLSICTSVYLLVHCSELPCNHFLVGCLACWLAFWQPCAAGCNCPILWIIFSVTMLSVPPIGRQPPRLLPPSSGLHRSKQAKNKYSIPIVSIVQTANLTSFIIQLLLVAIVNCRFTCRIN